MKGAPLPILFSLPSPAVGVHPEMKKVLFLQACNENQTDFIVPVFIAYTF